MPRDQESIRKTNCIQEIEQTLTVFHNDHQGPDFDDMSYFFPCEMDDAIQFITLGYGAQARKIVIL